MTERLPDDKARAARIALAVLAGALGTALFGAGMWMAFHQSSEDAPSAQKTIEPAEPSEAATMPGIPGEEATSTGSTTESTGPDGGGGGETPDGLGGSDAVRRAPLIAFRLGASVYVAYEDGSGANRIVKSPDGPYALSPDGKTLALVEGTELRLIDVASGDETTAGEAEEGFGPRWSADSSTLVYRRHKSGSSDSYELWTASRSGKGAARLADGEQAGYSPKGDVLVVLDASSGGEQGFVSVSVAGSALRPVPVTGGTPTAVGTNGDRLFVAMSNGEQGSALVSLGTDGRGQRAVAGGVSGDMPAIWSAIWPSPDGGLLGLQATGDDGYARAFIVPSAGGASASLSRRRDGKLHGWSATGERVFLVEGNAFQGEPTSLVSMKRDGSARRDVVTGAE
ncbi:MAG TPA: hypothetical protein VLA05_10390 [Coriobacteriia bacterium]|nr:hypothetical protein [Coriobacteriia bacterium]